MDTRKPINIPPWSIDQELRRTDSLPSFETAKPLADQIADQEQERKFLKASDAAAQRHFLWSIYAPHLLSSAYGHGLNKGFNRAIAKGSPRTQAMTSSAPPRKPGTLPSVLNPQTIEEFASEAHLHEGGYTGAAMALRGKVSPEMVPALQAVKDRFSQRTKVLTRMGQTDLAFAELAKSSFIRETIESVTNTGSMKQEP
jgi:hypothetical protein